ncbi:MAG TPA: hypothetical protein VF133_07105, partial [Terriglobales bacterium]
MRRAFRSSAPVLFSALVLLAYSPVAQAATEGSFDRTLHVSGAVNLDIETGSGSIQVHAGSTDEVRVTGHIRTNNWLFGSPGDAVQRL